MKGQRETEREGEASELDWKHMKKTGVSTPDSTLRTQRSRLLVTTPSIEVEAHPGKQLRDLPRCLLQDWGRACNDACERATCVLVNVHGESGFVFCV